jgi:MFS family permease
MKETLPKEMKSPLSFSLFKIGWNDVFEPKVLPVFWIMLLVSFSSGVVVTLLPDITKMIGWHNKGLYFTIYTVSSIVVRIFFSKSSDRHGRVPVLLISGLFLIGAMFLMVIELNTFTVVSSAVMFGISWGFNTPTLAAWTNDLGTATHMGRAMATMYMALEAGIGLGALVAGMFYKGLASQIVLPFLLAGLFAVISFILLLSYRQNWLKHEF